MFTENFIDGEALLCLTERAAEELIPVMGHRMKFLKLLGTLKQNKANSTSGDFTTHTAAASTTLTAATNQPDHETQVVTIAGDVAAESSQSKEPETAQNARYAHRLNMYADCMHFFLIKKRAYIGGKASCAKQGQAFSAKFLEH